MNMLYMQCYVHMVLSTYSTCSAMYIWCCVHDCTSGAMSMWCCAHVVHAVLCAGGAVYMSCIWRCVYVVSCTCACDVVYVWHCVHFI